MYIIEALNRVFITMTAQILQFIGLHLTDQWVIALIVLSLYFFDRSDKISTIALVTFTSICITHQWKAFFHIPLPKTHHSTAYAFPSGHLQLATVFYGALFYEYVWQRTKSLKTTLTLFSPLITIIAWATVAAEYHTTLDVLAGIVFGLTHLFVFYRLLKAQGLKKTTLICGLISLCILCIQKSSYLYLWEVFGQQCAFSMLILYNRPKVKENVPIVFLAAMGYITLVFWGIPIHSHDLPNASYGVFLFAITWTALYAVPYLFSLKKRTSLYE